MPSVASHSYRRQRLSEAAPSGLALAQKQLREIMTRLTQMRERIERSQKQMGQSLSAMDQTARDQIKQIDIMVRAIQQFLQKRFR